MHFHLYENHWYAAEFDPVNEICFGFVILGSDEVNSGKEKGTAVPFSHRMRSGHKSISEARQKKVAY